MAAVTARFKGDTRHLDAAVRRSGRGMNNMAKQSIKQFNVMGTSIGAIVHPLGLATIAASGLGNALNMFSEVDKRARQVAALIPNAGETELNKISETAAKVASEFNIGQQAALNALYEALSAGAPTFEAAAEVMTTAAKAQVSAGVDINEAAKFYQQQSGVWGLTAEHIADVTAATERLGSITTAQLVQDFGKVATAASLTGITLEETMAAIATLTQSGVVPAESVTQLNRLFSEATNANGKLYKAIKATTGKTFKELIADGKNLVQILGDLKDATGEQFLTSFGRETGARAAQVLLQQTERFGEKLVGINQATGELETNMTRAMDSTAFKIADVKQGFEDLKYSIGETIAPILAPALTELAATLTELSKTPEFQSSMAQLAQAMTDATPALLQLVDPMIKFATATSSLAYALLETGGEILDTGATAIDSTIGKIPPQVLEAALYAWIGNKILGPEGRYRLATAAGAARTKYIGAPASVTAGRAAGAATKTASKTATHTLTKQTTKGILKTGLRSTLAAYLGYEALAAATGFDPIDQLATDISNPKEFGKKVKDDAKGIWKFMKRAGEVIGDIAHEAGDLASNLSDYNSGVTNELSDIWTGDHKPPTERERAKIAEAINEMIGRQMIAAVRAYEGSLRQQNDRAAREWQIQYAYTPKFNPDEARRIERAYFMGEAAHQQRYGTPELWAKIETDYARVQRRTDLTDDITAALESRRNRAYGDVIDLAAELRHSGTATQNAELDERLATLDRTEPPSEKVLRAIADWLEQILATTDSAADSLDYLANEQKAAHYYAPITITAAEGAAIK